MEINKKRERDDKQSDYEKEDEIHSDEEDDEEVLEGYIDENGERKLNLPKKSKYRMHAHCNPLASISIPQ